MNYSKKLEDKILNYIFSDFSRSSYDKKIELWAMLMNKDERGDLELDAEYESTLSSNPKKDKLLEEFQTKSLNNKKFIISILKE